MTGRVGRDGHQLRRRPVDRRRVAHGRDRVALVLSFGGHGDLPRTLRYLCTGVQPGRPSRPPHDYGVVIILLGVADRVVPASRSSRCGRPSSPSSTRRTSTWSTRQARRARVRAREEARGDAARAGADAHDVGQRPRRRAPRTDAAAARHRDGRRSGAVAAANPPPSAPVYLLHGADDNVIPAVESKLLADDLRARGGRVHQLSTPLITHAEVDHPPRRRDRRSIGSGPGRL